MGNLGLSVLLLAVEVWLVVDCVSSLDVESVFVSSSELRLVDFCDSLVGSLDSVGAGESGLNSGMVSAFGFSLSSVAAELPFMARRLVRRLSISSHVSADGPEMVVLLCFSWMVL